jgi:rhomboid protease GluP
MTNFLRFSRAAPVSTSFAAICLLIYLAMVYTGAHFADPHSRALIEWGGNYRALTVRDQSWRLLTAIFVHGGLLHLVMNTMAIFDICWLLERRIGAIRLLLVLLLSGLSASLCSMIWSPLLVSVGASGAIMGAAGTLLVWLAVPGKEPSGMTPFIALIVGVTLTLGIGAFWHRLDNAAHIGGLITGVVMGLLLYPSKNLRPKHQLVLHFTLLVTGLLLAGLTIRRQNTDEYIFRTRLPTIAATLQQYPDSRQFLRTLQDGSADTFQQINQRWQQCIEIALSWQSLRLSASQELLGQQIYNVCRIQQQQYQFILQQGIMPNKNLSNLHFIRNQVQINGLYTNLLPVLQQELAITFAIEAQIGSIKPKYKEP